jgi:hypothetical protein
MEVHAHSHTPRLPAGKAGKKWTHYFWEFLMLFLAVFCGFLAEYQLEHKIEEQREKKYAKTLFEDLKVDTVVLRAEIRERNFVTPKIDTFRLLVHTKEIDEIPAGTWAYFARFGTRQSLVTLRDATLQQLLSSGGLRLFQKHNVASAIALYIQSVRDMKETLVFQDLMYSDLVKARNTLFDAWYLDEIMEINVSAGKIDSFKKNSFPCFQTRKRILYNMLISARCGHLT